MDDLSQHARLVQDLDGPIGTPKIYDNVPDMVTVLIPTKDEDGGARLNKVCYSMMSIESWRKEDKERADEEIQELEQLWVIPEEEKKRRIPEEGEELPRNIPDLSPR